LGIFLGGQLMDTPNLSDTNSGDSDNSAIATEDFTPAPSRGYTIGAAFIILILLVGLAYLQFGRGGGGATTTGGSAPGQLVTTASGLQYIDAVIGDGKLVEVGDMVVVNYEGFLEDGTMFDSSIERGQPFSFQVGLGNVIQGWDEGLIGMNVGGERELTIPPDLAYGEAGAGGVIPPNATLVFNVELVDVVVLDVEDLVLGEGPEAGPGNQVTVEYTAWFEDGTQLDSSAESGPLSFILGGGQIIPGLDFGIQGMQVGGKRLITIPPEFAFGAQGAGDVIPPNTTLVFEVELLSFE
jgi:peptidylprolyl isomerase